MSSPTVGHNSQAALEAEFSKIDPAHLAVMPEVVRGVLEYNYPDLPRRRDELIEDINDWVKRHQPEPDARPSIKGQADLKLTKDFLDQIAQFASKECMPAHGLVKRSILDAGKVVDDHFKRGLVDKVNAAAKPILDAYSARMITEHRNARAVLQQRAVEARLAAQTLAAQAAEAREAEQRESLTRLAQEAEDRASIADAEVTDTKAIELTRFKTDLGASGGVTTHWTYRVEEIMDLILYIVSGHPEAIKYLMINNDEAMASINAGNRKIPGLHIYEAERVR